MKILQVMLIVLISMGCSTYGPCLKPNQNAKNTYIKIHPEISEEFKRGILEGKILLGMSKNDVTVIWGRPDKIFPKGQPRFKYEPPPWNEQWLWKGRFFRTFSQDCTVTFYEERVENIQCDSFWGK